MLLVFIDVEEQSLNRSCQPEFGCESFSPSLSRKTFELGTVCRVSFPPPEHREPLESRSGVDEFAWRMLASLVSRWLCHIEPLLERQLQLSLRDALGGKVDAMAQLIAWGASEVLTRNARVRVRFSADAADYRWCQDFSGEGEEQKRQRGIRGWD